MKIIDAVTLKTKVHAAHGGGGELALLDIREHGQYGMGHPFFAVSCPYSILEKRAPQLVPRRSAPVVLGRSGGLRRPCAGERRRHQ